MHLNSSPLETTPNHSLSQLLKSLGPGIMMATAAVGGSHLVASTKAGAIYGWQLALVILLVNLLKYPFFRAGIQYTMGTGQSLIQGYSDLGHGYLWLFTLLNAISAVINSAALLLFSASLLGYFLPFELPLIALAAIVLSACLVILIAGHYKALDGLSKIIMLVLVIATLSAVFIAAGQGPVAAPHFEAPSAWSLAAIGFIVVMMGWMPAPIEISCLTSLWLKSQRHHTEVTPKSALFDFNVGYIGTAVLAIVFLALGALVMHGSGEALKTSGIGFSHQLVNLYASTIGEWARYLIAVIAFFCIFGSAITVIDGYSRALSEAQALICKKTLECRVRHQIWILVVGAVAMGILLFFTSALMTMLNFAMIMAFLTTPIFAWLNYKLLSSSELHGELAMGPMLRGLSRIGLVYLFGFMGLFIWWQWVS